MRKSINNFLLLNLFLFFCTGQLYAQQTDAGAINSPDAGGVVVDGSGVSNEFYEPSYFLGSNQYFLNLKVPPGRKNLTPKVWLKYDHHHRANQSDVGYGWQLNYSYIERSQVQGGVSYLNDDFIYHYEGNSYQLVLKNITEDRCWEYRLKYLMPSSPVITKCADRWFVYERDGSIKKFGGGFNHVLNNDGEGFRWYLASLHDANQNYISYYYDVTNHAQRADYSSYQVNLSSIYYTDHADSYANYKIDFEYSTPQETTYNFKPGFSIEHRSLLSEVVVSNRAEEIIYRYQFEYEFDQGLGLLKRFRTIAGEGENSIELPVKTFSYAEFDQNRLWSERVDFVDPLGDTDRLDNVYSLIDINGDSLPDRVFSNYRANRIEVYYNQGNGFSDNPVFFLDDICVDLCSGEDEMFFADINGDGLIDRVRAGYTEFPEGGGFDYQEKFLVHYNSGHDFSYLLDLEDPFCLDEFRPEEASPRNPNFCLEFYLIDFNGDGLLDRTNIFYDRLDDYKVFLNQGHEFSTTPIEVVDPGIFLNVRTRSEYRELIDINGDGLVDLVYRGGDLDLGQSYVYYGTGSGFLTEPYMWSDFGSHINENFTKLVDINGDKKVDRVISREGVINIHLNNGSGFNLRAVVMQDPVENGRNDFRHGDLPGFIDMNGDGIKDRVSAGTNGQYEVYLNNFFDQGSINQPLSLIEVDNGLGVKTKFSYRPAYAYKNRLLPIPLSVLTNIKTIEGNEVQEKTISYANGQFFGDWFNGKGRKFNGFGYVQLVDELGNVNQLWYHQAKDIRHGNLFYVPEFTPVLNQFNQIEIRETDDEDLRDQEFNSAYWRGIGASGRLFKKVVHAINPTTQRYYLKEKVFYDWDYTNQAGDFYYLSNEKKEIYEEGTDPRFKQKTYIYHPVHTQLIKLIQRGNFFAPLEPDRVTEYSNFVTFERPGGIEMVSSYPESKTIFQENTIKNRESYVYDDRFNLTSKTVLVKGDGLNEDYTYQYEYDQFGNATMVTSERGVVTEFEYDITKTYPSIKRLGDFSERFRYDLRFGTWIQKTDLSGRFTEREFDALGRLVSESFQGRWKNSYIFENKIPRGDNERFISSVKKYTNISSDPNSNRSPRLVQYYDGKGRLIQTYQRSEKDNLAYRMINRNYIIGIGSNREMVSEPRLVNGFIFREANLLNPTTTIKDSLDRVIEVFYPEGDIGSPRSSIQYQYGEEHNPWVEIFTNEKGQVKKKYFDQWRNVVRLVEYLNGQEVLTRYEYDFWHNIVGLTDPSGLNHQFSYDNLGRKYFEHRRGAGEKNYDYDSDGNLITMIDAKGNRIENKYDSLNRITESKSYNSNNQEIDHVQYIYDQAVNLDDQNEEENYQIRTGELFMVQDAEGFFKYSYDDFGNLIKKTRAINGLEEELNIEFEKDPDGRILNISYPFDLVEINYDYDLNGGLKTASLFNDPIYSINPNRDYNRLGQLVKETYGNDISNHYDYYPLSHRLLNFRVVNNNTEQTIKNNQYDYDLLGQIIAIKDLAEENELDSSINQLNYDGLNRLVHYRYNNPREENLITQYTYDIVGNILSVNGELNQEYDYNDNYQVLRFRGEIFEYDDNGNMISGRKRNYQYNSRNQLTEISLENGKNISFGYDYRGKRVKKITHNEEDQKSYLYLDRLFEVREDKYIYNIYAGNKLIAVKSIDPNEEIQPNNPLVNQGFEFRPDVDDFWPVKSNHYFYYVHTDHLGSSTLHTEGEDKSTHQGIRYQKGEVIQKMEYAPFGTERLVLNASNEENPKFTGQTQDLETDLYYYGARYYDPVLGRFIQPDSIIPDYSAQGINPYAYVYNNPLSYVDPSGNVGVRIHMRSFAPFESFGFGFHGDNRGFSTRVDESSRIYTSFNFDTETNSISEALSFSSSTSHSFGFEGKETSKYGIVSHGDGSIDAYHRGGNPVTKEFPLGEYLTPDINLQASFFIDEGSGYIDVSTVMFGDAFPNAETFITDGYGNSVMLNAFETEGSPNLGPFEFLPGSNDRYMGDSGHRIYFDESGRFLGGEGGGRSYYPELSFNLDLGI
jgi:RHS repeat-associated protein